MNKPVILRLSDYFLLCPRFDFLYKNGVCEECIKKGYTACINKKCVKNSLFASTIRVISMKIHKLIKVYDNLDAIITPTQYLKDKLQNNGFEKSEIYQIPTFSNKKEDLEKEVGDYGLYFGRITPEKGVEYIIKAYEKLDINHKLKIVGDDTTEEAQRLKKYVKDKKIKNVEFLGFKLGKELDLIISKSRFVLVPSIWYENLPNTILESFAYGKPVIATKIGSLTETIENGKNGFLFEIENIDQIVDNILKMDDEKLVIELGKNNLDAIEERYSVQKHYSRLIKLFNEKVEKQKE